LVLVKDKVTRWWHVLQLLDVSIVRDQKTGQSQGFAFLTVSFIHVLLTFVCIFVFHIIVWYAGTVLLLASMMVPYYM